MKIELEKRLIKFAVNVIELCNQMNNTYASHHLASQIIRSGSSSALNYGEAQHAQTRRDFGYKLSIVLKEIKETEINLEIIRDSKSSDNVILIIDLHKECRELIAIFAKTVQTLNNNSNKTTL